MKSKGLGKSLDRKLESMLNEASKEITGLYTIVVKDGNTERRFTFQSHKIGSLRKELAKRYGSKVVTKISAAIKKAETKGTLKNFATDDSVDFEINGEKVKSVFKEGEPLEEAMKDGGVPDGTGPHGRGDGPGKGRADGSGMRVMRKCSKTGKNTLVKKFNDTDKAKEFIKTKNASGKKYFIETTIEIKDPSGKNVEVDGKKFKGTIGDLKSNPKYKNLLATVIKKYGSLKSFGGDDAKVDISRSADGMIKVNKDA